MTWGARACLTLLFGATVGCGRPPVAPGLDDPTDTSSRVERDGQNLAAARAAAKGNGCQKKEPYALVGSPHGREPPHWVDCRTNERLEYDDAEFRAWRASHVAEPAR